MSLGNLGTYQWITYTSKKVGGPVNLLLITGGIGVIVGKISEICVKKGIKLLRTHRVTKSKHLEPEKKIYTVTSIGESNEGVHFAVGDQYTVLETDGDSALIETIGVKNNPYFVSVAFLRAISKYEE